MGIDPGAIVDQRVGATGGVSLHVRGRALDATGIPVLLVHGLASNARLWDGVAEHLAALGHPTAAVDQRGHGASDKPDGGYDFATLTADLVAVLEGMGWQPGSDRRPLVAGQSWGANVVLELAARHPDATRGLALVDGGTVELADRFADWPACEAALAPPALGHLRAGDFARMLRNRHPDWPYSGIEATLANVDVRPDGTIAPWLSRSHHLTILRHLWEHHPSSRYHDVKVPVLLLPAGSAGSVARTDKGDEIGRAEAGLAVSVTRWMAGDHDLHAQHPAEVASLLHAAAVGSLFPPDSQ
jgi:pimeloyl-ACP methyl ester carboxylesterase